MTVLTFHEWNEIGLRLGACAELRLICGKLPGNRKSVAIRVTGAECCAIVRREAICDAIIDRWSEYRAEAGEILAEATKRAAWFVALPPPIELNGAILIDQAIRGQTLIDHPLVIPLRKMTNDEILALGLCPDHFESKQPFMCANSKFREEDALDYLYYLDWCEWRDWIQENPGKWREPPTPRRPVSTASGSDAPVFYVAPAHERAAARAEFAARAAAPWTAAHADSIRPKPSVPGRAEPISHGERMAWAAFATKRATASREESYTLECYRKFAGTDGSKEVIERATVAMRLPTR